LLSLASVPGVEIAAHSRQHLWLPMQSAAVQREQIEQSKQRTEALLGRRIRGFSYPYGAWDRSCAALVREAGFAFAVTTEPRPPTGGDDLFAIPPCPL